MESNANISDETTAPGQDFDLEGKAVAEINGFLHLKHTEAISNLYGNFLTLNSRFEALRESLDAITERQKKHNDGIRSIGELPERMTNTLSIIVTNAFNAHKDEHLELHRRSIWQMCINVAYAIVILILSFNIR